VVGGGYLEEQWPLKGPLSWQSETGMIRLGQVVPHVSIQFGRVNTVTASALLLLMECSRGVKLIL